MKSDNELFDRAVRANGIGCRLPDHAIERLCPLLPYTKRFADQAIQGFRNTVQTLRSLPPIIVDYIDSPEAGAWALWHDNLYFIAIPYGMLFTHNYIFNRLLANREVLPQVGNIANEAEKPPDIPLSHSYSINLSSVQAVGLSMSDLTPRDAVRKEVADFLDFVSTYFLIHHEFRHIQAGHLEYGNDHLQCAFICESYALSAIPGQSMVKQAMEWDADRFAIEALLGVLWGNRNRALKDFQAAKSVFANDTVLVLLCLIACSAFFRLLDGDKPGLSDWRSLTHPPSRNRRMLLTVAATVFFDKIGKSQFADSMMTDVLTDYIESIEFVFARAGCTACDRAYAQLVVDESLAYQTELLSVWQSILNDLKQYSYVPLI